VERCGSPSCRKSGRLLLAQLATNPHTDIPEAERFVFWGTAPERPRGEGSFMLDALHEELENMGIDWKVRNIVFHGWRHFYAARIADIEAADKVSRITGHKSRVVFDAYADHVTEAAIVDMGKAAAVFAGVLAGAAMAGAGGIAPEVVSGRALRLAQILPEEPAEGRMSEDTIYLRQILALVQAALRERIGINLADVMELQNEIIVKADEFTKGIMPQNKAADFALKTSNDALEYGIHAREELQRLQSERKKPVQQSPEVEKFISDLNEEKRNLIQSENDRLSQLPISDLENLITELKRLREMAWYLTGHIQDYVKTPDYRERRIDFLTTVEKLPEPVPKEAESQTKPPLKGIDDLISQGYLADNGHRVLCGLNDVAIYLSGKNVAVTKALLKTYFVKKNGEEYSDRALTDAVDIANTK
jgi:hypothetical protein